MKLQLFKIIILIVLILFGNILGAQSLVITNAQVLDSNSGDVENGNIIIRNGRIASISNQSPPTDLIAIDMEGFTAIPGFIDAHRHIMSGENPEQWQGEQAEPRLKEFLDAGFTTVMEGGVRFPIYLSMISEASPSGE